MKKKIKKNNNKVSSPFGCNRCFCTAIYLLSCMYRVISSFTSCVSVVPPYRHLSRRASIFYFPSDLALLFRFLLFLPLPPSPAPPPPPLPLLLYFPWIDPKHYTFSNRTSKFHYERVLWLMECRKATCIAHIHDLNGGRKQFNNDKIFLERIQKHNRLLALFACHNRCQTNSIWIAHKWPTANIYTLCAVHFIYQNRKRIIECINLNRRE